MIAALRAEIRAAIVDHYGYAHPMAPGVTLEVDALTDEITARVLPLLALAGRL